MKLTEKDMSIMIGLILGDGFLDEKGRFLIQHCEKQKEYCEYKAKLLHSVCGGNDIKVHEYDKKYSVLKNKKQFKESHHIVYLINKQSLSFVPLREMLYNENGRKCIKECILLYFTPEVIALWWMDDGCLTVKSTYYKGVKKKSGYTLKICTYLPKEQNELIQDYFLKNYNMKWNVVKADGAKDDTQWMLRCGVREGRKFLSIIRDYIRKNVPSMNYKVLDI